VPHGFLNPRRKRLCANGDVLPLAGAIAVIGKAKRAKRGASPFPQKAAASCLQGFRPKSALMFKLSRDLCDQGIDLLQQSLTSSNKVGNFIPATLSKRPVFHFADVLQNIVLGAF